MGSKMAGSTHHSGPGSLSDSIIIKQTKRMNYTPGYINMQSFHIDFMSHLCSHGKGHLVVTYQS